tara:strand:+ start:167 stop:550 length:384 start_codon:yes stop_codon:yes gene_type:complete
MDKNNISKNKLRMFGLFLFALFQILSKWTFRFLITDFLMKVSLIITTVLFLILMIKPNILKKIFLGWIFCFNLLEELLLWLAFVFFLVPISLLTKIFGYDPLKMKNNIKKTYRQNKIKRNINLKKLH